MSVIWRKVWRDLWLNKLRTVLVILAMAVGVFALGLVFGLSGLMRDRMTEGHQAVKFPNIIIYSSRFDKEVVDTIRRQSGVAAAEGEDVVSIRWKLGGEHEWRDGLLMARPDYQEQKLDIFTLIAGQWPSQSRAGRSVIVERLSSQYFGLPVGKDIIVEHGRNGRQLNIGGIARVNITYPPQFGGDAVFYALPETTAWISGLDEGFNRLKIRLEPFPDEMPYEQGANAAAQRIEDKLRQMGINIGGYEIYEPNVHWMQQEIDAIILIIMVLGILSLGLSGFLIINTINATTAQQVWQIGVMKVVGATRERVMIIYLSLASFYGLLALFLAILPSAVAAHLIAEMLLDLFNIPVGSVRLSPTVIGIQFAAGLAVPLLAALIPVRHASRITAHQAISNYGLGGDFGKSRIDRLVKYLKWLPRPISLSFRNTFRRKARIALTLLTLIFAGVMFIIVMSLGTSMTNTVNVLLDDFGFDAIIILDRSYRISRLTEVAESSPGVNRAEVWDRRGIQLSLKDGSERNVGVWGVPTNSTMFRPRIVEGRNLHPQDQRAVLLNSKIAAEEGLGIGDQIKLTIGQRESTWTVVGLILNVNNNQNDNFVHHEALTRETGDVGRGRIVVVTSVQGDRQDSERLTQGIREVFSAHQFEIVDLQTAGEVREQNQAQFDMIRNLMLIMSVLAGLVGGIGLMSTMSINVVERRREIGVMRAIGATTLIIILIFITEGILVGLISWSFALPFSYPGSLLLAQAVGKALFKLPLDFSYSVKAAFIWLIIVLLMSIFASLLPARSASKVSVREALAYE